MSDPRLRSAPRPNNYDLQHTKTFNIIFCIIGGAYVITSILDLVDVSRYAFLKGVWKAVPIWLCAIQCLLANQSTMGIALVFGSAGDMMLEFRHFIKFSENANAQENLFELGVGLFAIQHLIMIVQLGMWYKKLRVWSFGFYVINAFVMMLINPYCPDRNLFWIAVGYSLLLCTSGCCAVNAVSYPHHLDFELKFVCAAMLFALSDTILILGELKVFPLPKKNLFVDGDVDYEHFQRQILDPVVMITYYGSQLCVANGAMSIFNHNRSRFKVS